MAKVPKSEKRHEDGVWSLTKRRGELDLNLLRQCAMIQCTRRESAALCQVSEDVIERKLKALGTGWKEFYAAHAGEGAGSLRREMYKNAMKGNVTMQIWLSKQYLGMKDKNEVSGDRENPIIHKIVREIVDVTPND